jgi:predicted Rossmann fold nucleotide-binding protein DprA/Smf involved in DNA uptake
MRRYIIADNQELTRFALESLLQHDEENTVYRAFDRAGLVALLKENMDAVVLVDYRLFDFADEEQLLMRLLREAEDGILVNDLAEETEMTYPDIITHLMTLEMKKRVRSFPGGKFRAV